AGQPAGSASASRQPGSSPAPPATQATVRAAATMKAAPGAEGPPSAGRSTDESVGPNPLLSRFQSTSTPAGAPSQWRRPELPSARIWKQRMVSPMNRTPNTESFATTSEASPPADGVVVRTRAPLGLPLRMLNPGRELANHAVPALTAKVAAPGGGVVVVGGEVEGMVVVLDGGSVVGTTGQRQSLPHVPPPGHATPAGSQVSPRDAVTTPSPQRAAQSVPASAQHE